MLFSNTKRDNVRHSRIFGCRRNLALVLVVSILSCLSLSSCKKVNNVFPEIPSSDSTETSQTTTSESTPEVKTIELTIASPLSYDTCQYLAKLYYAKSRGLLGEGVTGETVDLDYLSSIDIPIVISVYGTSENGCSTSTLEQWKNSGDMPDIFLTDSFDQVVNKSFARPITDELAENPLLSADRVYSQLLQNFYVDGQQYGIPYQTSAAVLYCDMEVLQQAGITSVNYRQTRGSLISLLSDLEKLNEEEQTVLPFYLAGNMMPYLPCSLFDHEYLSASDSDDRSIPSYRDAFSLVESIIRLGYSYESLSEQRIEKLFSGVSPILSRKLGIWSGTTDELMIYDNYMPNTLTMMQLPSSKDDEYSSPLLISYPLCVSGTCKYPKEACDLACFMALDDDALLLTSRLQKRQGYLPSVSSPSVWNYIVKSQKYGDYLIQFHDLMDRSIMIPAVSESEQYTKDIEYIQNHIEQLNIEKKEDITDED